MPAKQKDPLGNPIVFVQEVQIAGQGTTYQVIDRRLPSGARLLGEYEQESLAKAHADMVWRTP